MQRKKEGCSNIINLNYPIIVLQTSRDIANTSDSARHIADVFTDKVYVPSFYHCKITTRKENFEQLNSKIYLF